METREGRSHVCRHTVVAPMAPTRATLSTELLLGLDWRPLIFEHPLPPDRLCQVCGVVCKETVVLPCFHIVCNVCFEGSVALGCVCPLDREVFHQDDVDKLKLRPGQLLKLRVYCWNSALGCDFLGPVSELLGHFERACVHHRVPCPKCHQDVPRLGLVQHCVNGCDPTTSARASPPEVTHQLGGQLLCDLEEASADIKQSIAELKDGYYGLQASVNTVADDVQLGRLEARRAMTEIVSSLQEELQMTQTDMSQWGGQLLENFEKASSEIKRSVTKFKDGYHRLHTNVDRFVVDVNLGHGESTQVITEAASRTNWGGHIPEDKSSTEIKLSIAKLANNYCELQASVDALADDFKLGRSEAQQAKTEIVSNLLAQLQTTLPCTTHRGRQLVGASTVQQPATPPEWGNNGLQANVNTVADDVHLGCSEASSATTDTVSSVLPQSQTELSFNHICEDLAKLCAEIKQSINGYTDGTGNILGVQPWNPHLCSEGPGGHLAGEFVEPLINIG